MTRPTPIEDDTIRVGTPVIYRYESIPVVLEGTVTEIIGDYAHVLGVCTDKTFSLPLDSLERWVSPYPKFEAGHGRPDLDMLYQVAHALRSGVGTPVEVLHNVESYLTHRPSDIEES